MNWNSPHGDAGEPPEPTPEQARALRRSVSGIADATRRYLPDEFVVGSRVGRAASGVQATVAVQPPAGNTVSAGLTAEFDGEDGDPIDETDREEVARGLAAGAVLQAKQAMGDDFTPTAR